MSASSKLRLKSALVVALAVAGGAGAVWAGSRLDTLTVVSWGGRYTASQMIAYVEPYRAQTDLHVEVDDYNGGLAEVRAQVTSLNVEWDVVDMGLATAMRGCEEGLLEPIDPAILPPAPDGTPAAEDFLPGTLHRCAVGQNVFSTVIAWDRDAFGGDAPQRVDDFFDTDRFPGPRGLRRHPQVALEWALIADGVEPENVYDVLGSSEGVDRALDKLDELAPHIVWWENAAEPAELLEDQRVVMTAAYNGRIQAEIDGGRDDLVILWDAQVRDVEVWAIPNGTRKPDAARDFIAFASDPERMATQASHIAYGPARASAMAFVSADQVARLPTAPANSGRVVDSDVAWWTEHQAEMERRFEQWLDRQLRPRRIEMPVPPR